MRFKTLTCICMFLVAACPLAAQELGGVEVGLDRTESWPDNMATTFTSDFNPEAFRAEHPEIAFDPLNPAAQSEYFLEGAVDPHSFDDMNLGAPGGWDAVPEKYRNVVRRIVEPKAWDDGLPLTAQICVTSRLLWQMFNDMTPGIATQVNFGSGTGMRVSSAIAAGLCDVVVIARQPSSYYYFGSFYCSGSTCENEKEAVSNYVRGGGCVITEWNASQLLFTSRRGASVSPGNAMSIAFPPICNISGGFLGGHFGNWKYTNECTTDYLPTPPMDNAAPPAGGIPCWDDGNFADDACALQYDISGDMTGCGISVCSRVARGGTIYNRELITVANSGTGAVTLGSGTWIGVNADCQDLNAMNGPCPAYPSVWTPVCLDAVDEAAAMWVAVTQNCAPVAPPPAGCTDCDVTPTSAECTYARDGFTTVDLDGRGVDPDYPVAHEWLEAKDQDPLAALGGVKAVLGIADPFAEDTTADVAGMGTFVFQYCAYGDADGDGFGSAGEPKDCCYDPVYVEDTTAPNAYQLVTNACIEPSNHKFVGWQFDQFVTFDDICDPDLVITANCASNQSDNNGGDGETEADCIIVMDSTLVFPQNFLVRSERLGGELQRVYSVTISADDLAGNRTSVVPTVTVYHDSEMFKSAMDSGACEMEKNPAPAHLINNN